MLHNKKKLGVSGFEEDQAHFLDLKRQRELLYGNKLKQDGTVQRSPNRAPPKIKYFEGYQTQEYQGQVLPRARFELDAKELQEELSLREKEQKIGRLTETTYLDLSPKKFRPLDLSLQIKQLDLELERSIRANTAKKL